MLSLTRGASKRVNAPLIRRFAEVVSPRSQDVSTSSSSIQNQPSRNALQEGKIPVREDHGLYAFFRRKNDPNLEGDARFETVETPEESRVVTGRAWRASELRLKSFKDLHTLWYVSLRERNLLATQKEEMRRMGAEKFVMNGMAVKVGACQKTMARIKVIMNERRLAYQGAIELLQERAERVQDGKLLEMQSAAVRNVANQIEILKSNGRRLLRKDKRRKLTEAKAAAEAESLGSTETTQDADVNVPTAEVDASAGGVEAEAPQSPSSTPEPTVPSPQLRTATQTASAGLFGEPQSIPASKK